MDFAALFRRAWNIVWQNKFMIVLGFLAALGSGAGSGGGNTGTQFQGDEFPFPGSIPPGQVEEVLAAIGAAVGLLLCILFIVGILLWLLRLTAEAGLIDSAARLDDGEKSSFRQALSAGWRYLAKMVGLNIVLFGIFAFLAFVVAALVAVAVLVPVFSAAGAADTADIGALIGGVGIAAALLLCCLLCGLVLLGILVSILYPFAQRALVLEDRGVFGSIDRGWKVIRANAAEVLLLIIVLFVLSLLVGAVIFAVFIPIFGLTGAPLLIRLFSGQTVEVADFLLLGGGLLCLGLIGAAINAIYVAFRSTTVTLAYREFTGRKAIAAE